VRVRRPPWLERGRKAVVAGLLVPALLLAGCAGSTEKQPKAEPAADLPTGDVVVPDGVTLTKAGVELRFREPAFVAHQIDPQRGSVLSLSVDSVQEGRIADLDAYQLDPRTRKSRPYYVRTTVRNVGTGDLSGAGIPLYGVSSSNALVQPSSFTSSPIRWCPSAPLPTGFGAGKALGTCLVYLVPDNGTLVEISYRPRQDFEPITWKGTIAPPVVRDSPKAPTGPKKNKKQSKNKNKKANP